jgi:hypothetical protein
MSEKHNGSDETNEQSWSMLVRAGLAPVGGVHSFWQPGNDLMSAMVCTEWFQLNAQA